MKQRYYYLCVIIRKKGREGESPFFCPFVLMVKELKLIFTIKIFKDELRRSNRIP